MEKKAKQFSSPREQAIAAFAALFAPKPAKRATSSDDAQNAHTGEAGAKKRQLSADYQRRFGGLTDLAREVREGRA